MVPIGVLVTAAVVVSTDVLVAAAVVSSINVEEAPPVVEAVEVDTPETVEITCSDGAADEVGLAVESEFPKDV